MTTGPAKRDENSPYSGACTADPKATAVFALISGVVVILGTGEIASYSRGETSLLGGRIHRLPIIVARHSLARELLSAIPS